MFAPTGLFPHIRRKIKCPSSLPQPGISRPTGRQTHLARVCPCNAGQQLQQNQTSHPTIHQAPLFCSFSQLDITQPSIQQMRLTRIYPARANHAHPTASPRPFTQEQQPTPAPPLSPVPHQHPPQPRQGTPHYSSQKNNLRHNTWRLFLHFKASYFFILNAAACNDFPSLQELGSIHRYLRLHALSGCRI